MATKTKENFTYTEEVTGNIVNIPITLLHHHHQNPRKEFGDLTELADSIKKNGVYQNLTVVPFWFDITGVGCDDPKEQAKMGYLVVIGNRRLEAAKIAGLKTLPCIISDMSHKEQLSTMLVENMQRCDLTVYEQAQGFQMMLKLGESVESIAEKSGFSQSTVRRRVKLAELDQDTLKEVSSRQITMDDFEKLNKIEDLETRNKVLSSIGTNNFSYECESAIRKEKEEKLKEKAKEILLSKGLKEITYEESYSGEYEKCPELDYYYNFDKITENLDIKDAEVFALNCCAAYLKRKKADKKPDNNSNSKYEKEEAERKSRVKSLDELSEIFEKNRREFVDTIPVKVIKENTPYILATIIYAGMTFGIFIDDENLSEKFNIKLLDENVFSIYDALNIVEGSPDRILLDLALCFLENSDNRYHHSYYGYYEENEIYDEIYRLLIKLGYQMSDEEEKYRNGTHELFAKE